jgi:leader peptidase (prepilin peptidase)/N-methyltransferase
MGDVVLMAAAGLMLGYRAVIVAAFIGIVIGALYGIYLKHRENDGEDSGKFAFGPFLCIGIAAAVFAGNIIWNAYMGLIR